MRWSFERTRPFIWNSTAEPFLNCYARLRPPYLRLAHRVQMGIDTWATGGNHTGSWTGIGTYDFTDCKVYSGTTHLSSELLDISTASSYYGSTIEPVVMVKLPPAWSGVMYAPPRQARGVHPSKYNDLKNYASALQAAFPTVSNWEYGNEPNSDSSAIINQPTDPFYGAYPDSTGGVCDFFGAGQRFGNEITAFSQGIKLVNPSAKIWSGGLVASYDYNGVASSSSGPNSPASEFKDMIFMEGMLSTGSSAIDIVPIHYETDESWGYFKNGKKFWESSLYLYDKTKKMRQIMAANGGIKPISWNECALWTLTVTPVFRDRQVAWAETVKSAAEQLGIHSVFYYDDPYFNSELGCATSQPCEEGMPANNCVNSSVPLYKLMYTDTRYRC